MATTSISSLLGLRPPPPVIAPNAVEKRLSKTEMRVATAAYHRARGYSDGIDFHRFRDTVLQEAFTTMPLFVMQRVFSVWNYCEIITGGSLTLKEFLVGVTIVWKGTRDEHLRFVFQLMDRHAEQELSKRDALAFCRAVARSDDVVAVDEEKQIQWTVDKFVRLLFPTDKTLLTPVKFVKMMTAQSFTWVGLTDWIPKLATQFDREKDKIIAATFPRSQQDDEVSNTSAKTGNPMLPLSITITRAGALASPKAMVASPRDKRKSEADEYFHPIIEIEAMRPDQFHNIKLELHGLIGRVLSTHEPVSDADIQERLKGLVPQSLLQAAASLSRDCSDDFIFHGMDLVPQRNGSQLNSLGRARGLWWILCICCACSRSSTEVLRYLFVVLDDESRGYWTVEQLTRFILLTDSFVGDDVTQTEAAFLAQTTFDDIESKRHTLLSNDVIGGDDIVRDGDVAVFRYRDFEKYWTQYPIPGCSAAEVDTLFTLYHLRLAQSRDRHWSHRQFFQALEAYCSEVQATQSIEQLAFCLLPRSVWFLIVDSLCDYSRESPLATCLKTQLSKPNRSGLAVRGSYRACHSSAVRLASAHFVHAPLRRSTSLLAGTSMGGGSYASPISSR